MPRRSVWMTWASLSAALALPGSTEAATQLGQTAAPNALCGDVITWIQTQSAVNYVVPPEGGVITAWSHRATEAKASSVKLKVVRQANSTTQFTTVGTSALKTVSANGFASFPAQIRVKGGDLIGLYTNTKQMGCGTNMPTETVRWTSGDVVIGTNRTYANTSDFRLDVAATVELDLDSDGLGDESQDPTPPAPTSPGDGGGGGGGTGGGATPGQTQPPSATPPRVELLVVSPSVFSTANLGRSIFARVGARVTYVLSEAATVTFRVERRLAGRRVRGRCVRPTRANRLRGRCTRYVLRRGSFTHFGTTIVNRFTFSGRIGSRALPPGRYRLVARATNAAGAPSRVVRAPFRVVR